jgi:hypothetical protein
MEKQRVINFAIILQMDPTELINDYGCGRNKITVQEAKEIEQKQYEFATN